LDSSILGARALSRGRSRLFFGALGTGRRAVNNGGTKISAFGEHMENWGTKIFQIMGTPWTVRHFLVANGACYGRTATPTWAGLRVDGRLAVHLAVSDTRQQTGGRRRKPARRGGTWCGESLEASISGRQIMNKWRVHTGAFPGSGDRSPKKESTAFAGVTAAGPEHATGDFQFSKWKNMGWMKRHLGMGRRSTRLPGRYNHDVDTPSPCCGPGREKFIWPGIVFARTDSGAGKNGGSLGSPKPGMPGTNWRKGGGESYFRLFPLAHTWCGPSPERKLLFMGFGIRFNGRNGGTRGPARVVSARGVAGNTPSRLVRRLPAAGGN